MSLFASDSSVGCNGSIRGLGDETILDILESGNLTQQQLANVCLTCRRLRRIAIVRLYRRIEISGDRRFQRLHQLLRSVLQNDSLGSLVATLSVAWYKRVGSWIEELYPGESNQGDEFGVDMGELELFFNAVRSRTLEHEIIQALEKGSEDAKILVLLDSLPNLEALSVVAPSACQLFDTHFTQWAINGQSFSNLKFFDRRWPWGIVGESVGLALLLPAFLIPTVLTIKGSNAFTGDEIGHPGPDLSPYYGTSSVAYIELAESRISGEKLSRMLRLPKALRYFGFKEGGSGTEFIYCSGEEFGGALQHSSSTLEFLSIIASYRGWINDHSTIGSLQHFKHLRELEITFDLLLGVNPETAAELVDVLPSSLEKLFLNRSQGDEWDGHHYLGCVERLVRRKGPVTVPALHVIGIRPKPECLIPLLAVAAEKGIAISSCINGPRSDARFSHNAFPVLWRPFLRDDRMTLLNSSRYDNVDGLVDPVIQLQ